MGHLLLIQSNHDIFLNSGFLFTSTFNTCVSICEIITFTNPFISTGLTIDVNHGRYLKKMVLTKVNKNWYNLWFLNHDVAHSKIRQKCYFEKFLLMVILTVKKVLKIIINSKKQRLTEIFGTLLIPFGMEAWSMITEYVKPSFL